MLLPRRAAHDEATAGCCRACFCLLRRACLCGARIGPIPVEYNLARKTYLECEKRPDGIYIPCGGWGSIRNIDLLERDLDTTVVTWMNAWIWSAFKHGKVSGPIEGHGKRLASINKRPLAGVSPAEKNERA